LSRIFLLGGRTIQKAKIMTGTGSYHQASQGPSWMLLFLFQRKYPLH
jgi:hypothetical protein